MGVPQIFLKTDEGLKRIGRGAYGQVWLLSEAVPKMVVKKALRKQDYSCQWRELDTLKALSHENVVRYYDCPGNYVQSHPHDLLIFTQYCEHGSLTDVLADTNLEYSMATIAKWSTEMFSALEYLKNKKMVHHDVKPANLFIYGHDYILKMGDFGFARELQGSLKFGGGTIAYMAPEVQMLKTRVGENAYKCDIYGAGWVVLDMVNRSGPGNQNIDALLKEEHLATIKKLVEGCTARKVEERFSVEKALELCKEISLEFKDLHAKPNPDRHHKTLETPTGLKVESADGSSNSLAAVQSSSISSSTAINSSRELPNNRRAKVEPREGLLIELKEQLGTTIEFIAGDFQDTQKLCQEGEELVDCEGDDHQVCTMTRKQLCEKILENLCKASLGEQYTWAEMMDKYWKVEAPALYKTIMEAVTPGAELLSVINAALNFEKPLSEIMGTFIFLTRRDALQQWGSQLLGIEQLIEADEGTLPAWDLLQLLNETIHDIEELRKLFTVRAIYPIAHIEGSRHSWYYLQHYDIFLRKDCTEIRRNCERLLYHETKEKEPLNNEQIRRALIEARADFERKLRTQRQLLQDIPETKGLFEMIAGGPDMIPNMDWDLYSLMSATQDQPFPGYFFLHGIPPRHQVSSVEQATFVRFVPVRLSNITWFLYAMRDSYRPDCNESEVDPDIWQTLVDRFWDQIMKGTAHVVVV